MSNPTEDAISKLSQSWRRGWRGVSAVGDGEPVFSALLAAYREPQRKYHTLQHLGECLSLFEVVQNEAAHPAEVELGLWFHDAVYDVKGSGNEERSAEWARVALIGGGAPAAAAARVHTLVMATRHTAAPASLDEQILVDIDLAILGASEQRFAEYEQQIRAEYAYVPKALFNEKRREILQSFLHRESIFTTPHLRAQLEARARMNLANAIAKIVRPAPAGSGVR